MSGLKEGDMVVVGTKELKTGERIRSRESLVERDNYFSICSRLIA